MTSAVAPWGVAVLALLQPGCSERPGPPAEGSTGAACVVAAVADGDTLRCRDGRTVRLVLIDAPELAHRPFGATARDALIRLAPAGTPLAVEYDAERVDDFGRELAYLYAPAGFMVNERMVETGHAVVLVIRPNGRHEARMRAAMARAREGRAGLWAEDGFACLPRDFRAGRCG